MLEHWKEQDHSEVVRRLLDLAAERKVELAVTARIREDVPRPPLTDRLNELPALNVVETPSVTRVGFWVLGRDMLGSDEFVAFSFAVDAMLRAKGAKSPDWRDWDHLHAHYLLKRDLFLTWDQPLLAIAPQAKARFGIEIISPEAFLARLTAGSSDEGSGGEPGPA